eukprot:Skav201516  [mRNA]  locus=scaffold1623:62734:65970:+ [translate_table: standard]
MAELLCLGHEGQRCRTRLMGSAVGQRAVEEPFKLEWGKGIVGMVANEGKIVNLPDAHDHPAFDGEIEKKTGYRGVPTSAALIAEVKGLLSLPVKSGLASYEGDFPGG